MNRKILFIEILLATLVMFFVTIGTEVGSWGWDIALYAFYFIFIMTCSSVTYGMWYYYYQPEKKYKLFLLSFLIFSLAFSITHWNYLIIALGAFLLTILYTFIWVMQNAKEEKIRSFVATNL